MLRVCYADSRTSSTGNPKKATTNKNGKVPKRATVVGGGSTKNAAKTGLKSSRLRRKATRV